jgi:hypothetical protein
MTRDPLAPARRVWRPVLYAYRRFRRANDRFATLLALDLLPWRDSPRDRLLSASLERRAEILGPYALERALRRRRPGRGPRVTGAPGGLDVLVTAPVDDAALLSALEARGHRVARAEPGRRIPASPPDVLLLAPSDGRLARAAARRGVPSVVWTGAGGPPPERAQALERIALGPVPRPTGPPVARIIGAAALGWALARHRVAAPDR